MIRGELEEFLYDYPCHSADGPHWYYVRTIRMAGPSCARGGQSGKDGKTSKEIADILNVSETTINFNRKNLRAKFGLTNQRTNLRSYLLSIS